MAHKVPFIVAELGHNVDPFTLHIYGGHGSAMLLPVFSVSGDHAGQRTASKGAEV
jgi:hypothetical protein